MTEQTRVANTDPMTGLHSLREEAITTQSAIIIHTPNPENERYQMLPDALRSTMLVTRKKVVVDVGGNIRLA